MQTHHSTSYSPMFQHTLGDLLRRTSKRYPHKTALSCGDVTWTYAEFEAITQAMAGGLAQHGVKLGDKVAVISRNSHAFAALRCALATMGAVLVPMNFMLSAAGREANKH